MECPKWLLEAMETGVGVKCWVWDGHDVRMIETVIGFDVSVALPMQNSAMWLRK